MCVAGHLRPCIEIETLRRLRGSVDGRSEMFSLSSPPPLFPNISSTLNYPALVIEVQSPHLSSYSLSLSFANSSSAPPPPPPRSSIRSAQLPQLMGLDLRRLPPFFRHPPSLHRSLLPSTPPPPHCCQSKPHHSLRGDSTISSQ